ncbi:MAG: SWIM zinc finger family protein, partial [Prevotellaceae bacterium]|nr:SWIM zinc finger family protein [Prevotellaceae bacterium]
MTDIYDLQQIDDNSWQARYHGNYGDYTIKLTLDGQLKVKKYSCTCPSDYSPCKHIGFVQA